ncbi:ABC transporter, ATP-binding protein, putative [Synechococcus sp. PCC 7335]|uniref:ABC transporter ATP-binding protein n=1 Tax=Synechococcus sp. (strain ATCC 29403 / PCC 7335) TaxID=91464 RepID=UPI00017EB061|nr:ATP-binding cassette domain-containing protein [Synechococcus sp. PCC 7335]EDX85667.1 ABC transporter, ATP-binding protein, putative [Synechococcus sp. PCC 7335]
MSVLTFDRVTMRATAGIVEILKEVTFALETGDFVALVGPSGSGKTSLLRLMNRLAEASSGQIRFEDKDIQQIPVVSLRRQVALVTQESRLLGMSVEAALSYPLQLRNQSAAKIKQSVSLWSERLKIPVDWLDRTAVHLSLGQRQRVAIARALITQPKVLLLDEPTSAQDVGYSEFLLTRLAELTHQNKLAIVMANHQIELVARYANRLWQIDNGRLTRDVPAIDVDWLKLHQQLVRKEQEEQANWT